MDPFNDDEPLDSIEGFVDVSADEAGCMTVLALAAIASDVLCDGFRRLIRALEDSDVAARPAVLGDLCDEAGVLMAFMSRMHRRLVDIALPT